jgi:hypothetical protein
MNTSGPLDCSRQTAIGRPPKRTASSAAQVLTASGVFGSSPLSGAFRDSAGASIQKCFWSAQSIAANAAKSGSALACMGSPLHSDRQAWLPRKAYSRVWNQTTSEHSSEVPSASRCSKVSTKRRTLASFIRNSGMPAQSIVAQLLPVRTLGTPRAVGKEKTKPKKNQFLVWNNYKRASARHAGIRPRSDHARKIASMAS